MGCDIHFNVERRQNDRWKPVFPKPQTCCQCGGSGKLAAVGQLADGSYGPTGRFEGCWHCSPGRGSRGQRLKGTGRCRHPFYSERNYTVFSVLAGVREVNVQPIDWPRSLPPDLSAEFAEFLGRLDTAYQRFHAAEDDSLEQEQALEAIVVLQDEPHACDIGDHSISWLTIRELLEYNWPQTHPDDHTSTLADDCDDFLESLHQRLLPLGHPDDVRIVFGFDS